HRIVIPLLEKSQFGYPHSRPLLDARIFRRLSCPPGRKIVVKRSDTGKTCSSADVPKTFKIPANGAVDYRDYSAIGAEMELEYNCSRYGVPIPAYYGSLYKPTLELWDNKQFVRTVDADFILFEVNGRSTFTYNTTAQQICRQKPQTWKSMILNSPNIQPFNAWSSSNYVPCYGPGDARALETNDRRIKYEILRHSTDNRIQWEAGINGLYIFKVKVLDQSFSYCELTTEYAVQVFGAPIAAEIQAAIVIGIIGGVLLILFFSYLWYRRTKSKEKES
ncbi:cation channel sperm-associated protein subunit delta-domain-containing protein, partial [Paraphysoderma sedebokerense]